MSSTKLTLSDKVQTVDIPIKLTKLEPARVSRYLITANLIQQAVGDINNAKVLDVGGKKGLLREFGIKSTIIDIEESSEKDYIQGDALNMSFKSNSFDMVVSCDVLEHISKNDREKFIEEMVRVSKGYVVICAPFDHNGVSNSEKQANLFYKEIAQDNHRWLIEHIENGLPNETLIKNFLVSRKLSYKFFNHLSLDVWDITTRIHFLNAVFGDSRDINKLSSTAYKKYYEQLCRLDYSNNGYRTFCVINKNGEFSLDLPDETKQESAKSQYKNFLNKQMIDSLKGLAIARRELQKDRSEEIDKYITQIAKLEADFKAKNEELQAIKISKSYRLAQKLSKAKNFYK